MNARNPPDQPWTRSQRQPPRNHGWANEWEPYRQQLIQHLPLLFSSILLLAFVLIPLATHLIERWRPTPGPTPSAASASTSRAPPSSNAQSGARSPLLAADHTHDHKRHLLLAASGSVATIKIPQILHALSAHPNLSIRLILSASAARFLQGQSAEQPHWRSLLHDSSGQRPNPQYPNLDGIYLDADEWTPAWTRGAPILHIELRRWADLMVIAPLSANTLARLVNGFSDDLVASVVRAWDARGEIDDERPGAPWPYPVSGSDAVVTTDAVRSGRRKGIIVAPAMNTAMWKHHVTAEHLARLEGEVWNVAHGGWFEVLRPVEKTLACGDTGSGAMRNWSEIVEVVEERLQLGVHGDGAGPDGEEGYVAVEVGKSAAGESSLRRR